MKVTVFYVIIFVIGGCQNYPDNDSEAMLVFQHQVDSIAGKKIDSVYEAHIRHCDSLVQARVPVLVDSILAADSLQAATHQTQIP